MSAKRTPRRSLQVLSCNLLFFLEELKLGTFHNALIDHGFDLENIANLTAEDLKKMRVTNTKTQTALLAAAQSISKDPRNPQGISFSGTDSAAQPDPTSNTFAQVATQAADNQLSAARPPPNAHDYTATFPTATECARQATIFLEHRREDRAWPPNSSELARAMNLSTATPRQGGQDTVMYTLRSGYHDSIRVPRPHSHEHGQSAKSCPVCKEHISESLHEGQWQYQMPQAVIIGDQVAETVLVWKPFEAVDSLRIDFAWKKGKPGIKIGKNALAFKTMKWGSFPVRRANFMAVPFPTLPAGEFVPPPPPVDDKIEELEQQQRNLFQRLLQNEEQKARLLLFHQETADLGYVLALIKQMMQDLFATQRKRLADEEAKARQELEDSVVEPEIEQLWYAAEEASVAAVQDVVFRDVRRTSDNVLLQQYNILEQMEELARHIVEDQEVAERANMCKLLTRFNTQVRTMLQHKHVPMSRSDGTRCPICHKKECSFFHQPWKNHWRHRGGALDFVPDPVGVTDLQQLYSKANEMEYEAWARESNRKHRARTPKPPSCAMASAPCSPSPERMQRRSSESIRRPFRCGSALEDFGTPEWKPHPPIFTPRPPTRSSSNVNTPQR